MSYNLNNQAGRAQSSSWGDVESLKSALSSCLMKVFLRMFTALVVTAITAFAVVSSDSLQSFVYANIFVFYGLLIGELVLVFVLSARINKMSVTAANALFFLYAILNGLTMSCIFFVYNLGTIYTAFGVSAVMFAIMAGFGALTRRDLSSVGSICFMGLIGIILASLINFFLRSAMMDYIICYAGVLIFIGLTAYDTQRIKKMLAEAGGASQEEAIQRISVIGALSLYLDFINMFLMILRIMGRRR